MQYSQDDSYHRYIRKLLALPFLPSHEIIEQFEQLESDATTSQLQQLVSYIRKQWIDNTLFTPQDWCVYGQPIRTNNDIEGWHNALNRRACGRSNLPLYMLVELLHKEAQLALLTIKLVSDHKLTRVQRKKYRVLQGKIFSEWDKYQSRERTGRQLLRAISKINGPGRCL